MRRTSVLITISAVSLVLYAYLNPPGPYESLPGILPFFRSLNGDMPEYAFRFATSSFFLGLIPLTTAFLLGYSPAEIGLRAPVHRFFRTPMFPMLTVFCILIGFTSSFDPSLFSFYPYSRTLALRVTAGAWGAIPVHAAAYGILYYIPWEIFFRGILILPFIQDMGEERGLPAVALLQCFPSSLIHFGHPITETLGAVLFGIFAAWLVVRTRSIWPSFILHFALGISLDAAIIIRMAVGAVA